MTDYILSTRVEAASGALPANADPSVSAGSGSAVEHGGAPSSGAANSAQTLECPSCLALRGTSRLLAESALYLIDRNSELTRQLEAYRAVERGAA